MAIVRSIIARIQALFAWWIADIRRRPSLIGKAASLGIGLIVICCVCSLPVTLVRRPSAQVSPTVSVSRQPTETPEGLAVAVQPSATPELPTAAPAPTALPSATPEPTAIPPTVGPTQTPLPSATPEPPTAPPSFADQVRAAVSGALSKGNRDLERISTIEAEENGRIYVQWTINDNLTEGFIKNGAQLDIKNILKGLHDSGVSYQRVVFEGSFPLVDTLGNSKEAIVVHAEYPRKTVDAINWGNFLTKNTYVIAEKVAIHPAFRE